MGYVISAIIACLNSVLLLPIFGAISRRGPCPGHLVLLFPISIKPLDILFHVDYYRLINKLTAKEKPMIDQVYVAVITDNGASIGIAQQDIRGYFTLDNMPEFWTYREAQEYAEELNTKLGVTPLEAWQIVASSMRASS